MGSRGTKPRPLLCTLPRPDEPRRDLHDQAIHRHAREGWAGDAQRMAQSGEATLIWPDFPNSDDTELTW